MVDRLFCNFKKQQSDKTVEIVLLIFIIQTLYV